MASMLAGDNCHGYTLMVITHGYALTSDNFLGPGLLTGDNCVWVTTEEAMGY